MAHPSNHLFSPVGSPLPAEYDGGHYREMLNRTMSLPGMDAHYFRYGRNDWLAARTVPDEYLQPWQRYRNPLSSTPMVTFYLAELNGSVNVIHNGVDTYHNSLERGERDLVGIGWNRVVSPKPGTETLFAAETWIAQYRRQSRSGEDPRKTAQYIGFYMSLPASELVKHLGQKRAPSPEKLKTLFEGWLFHRSRQYEATASDAMLAGAFYTFSENGQGFWRGDWLHVFYPTLVPGPGGGFEKAVYIQEQERVYPRNLFPNLRGFQATLPRGYQYDRGLGNVEFHVQNDPDVPDPAVRIWLGANNAVTRRPALFPEMRLTTGQKGTRTLWGKILSHLGH